MPPNSRGAAKTFRGILRERLKSEAEENFNLVPADR